MPDHRDLRERIVTYLTTRRVVSMDQMDGYFDDVEFIDLVEALADLEGTGTVEIAERGEGAFRLSEPYDC